jgi:Mg-chelatase subunit ChlD
MVVQTFRLYPKASIYRTGILIKKPNLHEGGEVIANAKKLGGLADFNVVVIDTEDRFVGTGIARDIAKASLGTSSRWFIAI